MKNYKEKIYHKLINNKVSYSSKTIDRYKKNNDKKVINTVSVKIPQLEKLKKHINSIKNCDLKNNATNMVFADGNPNSSLMIMMAQPLTDEEIANLAAYLIDAVYKP